MLLAWSAASCGGDDGAVAPVASDSCAEVLYEGEGEPDVIVVSDLPRRGIGAETTKLMTEAIEFVLRERTFRAGEYRVGYQSCNDTVGDEPFDPPLCKQNARDYVATDGVVGIIGPWNSACAFEQIPIVSRKVAGPLAMISPSNTWSGLTRTAPGADRSGPALYPDGVRSYVRVVTYEVAQGIAAAHLARRLGARRAAVVHQDLADEYIRALTVPFVSTARDLGLDVEQFEWPRRKTYGGLAASVAAADPEAVFLAGTTQRNGNSLVKELRAALGPGVNLVASDAFASGEVAKELGRAGEGMLVTVPGVPEEELPPSGKKFLREFGPASTEPGFFGAPEAAQAAEVLLDAIADSDGTRASVVEKLFATNVDNGLLGSFSFDRYGDIVPAPVGIYRFEKGEIVADGVIRAPLDQVRR
jgi:branched-chain amino acid transport system substrate-binding protein